MVLLIIIPIKWLFHWEYTLFSDKPLSMQGIVPCQALPTIPVFRGRGTPDFGHFWTNTWNRNLKALWMAKEGKIRMSPSWLRLSCQFLVEIKLHPAKRDSHTSWIQKLYLKFNPTSNYRDAPSTWYDPSIQQGQDLSIELHGPVEGRIGIHSQIAQVLTLWWRSLPSGELTFCYGKSPFFYGKIHYFYGHFPLLC